MTRSHFGPRQIRDTDDLHLITDATIRVLEAGTTTPISQTIYANPTTGTTLAQGWTADEGKIDFYLNIPQVVRIELTIDGDVSYIEDQWIGPYLPWRKSVLDYGAVGDGSHDDTGAIQDAIDDMADGQSLYWPDGIYRVSDIIQQPTVDYASFIAPIGSQVGLPPAVLQAAPGSNLDALLAPKEWITNGDTSGRAKGFTIQGLGFDGGGFTAGSDHDDEIETTSNVRDLLVMNGIGWNLDHVFCLSANRYGIHATGIGRDGSTSISEGHECEINDSAIRFTGDDALHGGPGAQDVWVRNIKSQYSGGHSWFIDNNCAAWRFHGGHPSWAVKDLIHLKSAWQVQVQGVYAGGLGIYSETTGSGYSDPHYGIYIEGGGGAAILMGNSINDFPPLHQDEEVVGICLNNFQGDCIANTLKTNDTTTHSMLEEHSTDASSTVFGNHDWT